MVRSQAKNCANGELGSWGPEHLESEGGSFRKEGNTE